MNTTKALTQIEEQRSAAIAKVAKKHELKWQKEDNTRRTTFFRCTQQVAKHFSDLQTKAQKWAEKELKEHLNHEEREAAKVAKVAEKVVAKQAEHKQKACTKAEKAALDAATKGHKGVSSRGKRKAVSNDKENEIDNQGAPPILIPSPKHHCTASPQPSVSSPSRCPPQHCPHPCPAWVGVPGYSAVQSPVASGTVL
jgi:hypothetical protein